MAASRRDLSGLKSGTTTSSAQMASTSALPTTSIQIDAPMRGAHAHLLLLWQGPSCRLVDLPTPASRVLMTSCLQLFLLCSLTMNLHLQSLCAVCCLDSLIFQSQIPMLSLKLSTLTTQTLLNSFSISMDSHTTTLICALIFATVFPLVSCQISSKRWSSLITLPVLPTSQLLMVILQKRSLLAECLVLSQSLMLNGYSVSFSSLSSDCRCTDSATGDTR